MPIFWVSGTSESHTVKNNLQRIFEREQYSHAKIFAAPIFLGTDCFLKVNAFLRSVDTVAHF